jgi:hypothetical protein
MAQITPIEQTQATVVLKKNSPPTIDSFQLDCTISEEHQFNNNVTQFPVESGVAISDHILNQPIKLTMDGFVTNSPIVELSNAKQVGNSREEISNRTELAFDFLMRLWRRREPVTVVTPTRQYENMALSSLKIPRSAEIGDSFKFSAEFQEIRIVYTSSVSTENIVVTKKGDTSGKAGAKEQGSAEKNGGTNSTKKTEKKVSALKNLSNRLSVLGK